MSPNSFFDGPQKSRIFFPVPAGSFIFSGLMSRMTHTADMTSLTPAGGFAMDFTIVMSAGWSTQNKQYISLVSLTRTGDKRAGQGTMYLERVESGEGGFQGRDGFSQVTLTLFLQCLWLRRLLIGYSFVLTHQFTARLYFSRLLLNYLLETTTITITLLCHTTWVRTITITNNDTKWGCAYLHHFGIFFGCLHQLRL